MNRPDILDFGERELTATSATLDAYVLDEEAWEDATDEASVDCEILRHSHWRSSTVDSID
jgi:hypothetical protein